MKVGKISLTDADGTVIALWDIQDMKGLSNKECEEATTRDGKYQLLLFDSNRPDINYMDDIQSEIYWFFTQKGEGK